MTRRWPLVLLALVISAAASFRLVWGEASFLRTGRQPAADGAPGASPTQPSPSPSPPPARFTLSAVGDVLTHEGIANRARRYAGSSGGFDFRPMFDRVKPILSAADVAICNLESPLSKNNRNLSYYPRFHVPREIAAALADAGFDVCSTANNHSNDVGPDGVVETLDVLDANRIAHAGSGRTPEEAARPAVLDVKGIRLAFLSYTFSLNGLDLPSDRTWMVNMIKGDKILADAQAARSAGAEFVIVALHWGTEYQAEPNESQRALSAQLLGSPLVDLILGHHTHVIQPIAKVGEKYVIYGMGNFISRQGAYCCPAETQDGIIVNLTIEEAPGGAAVRSVNYIPTWVEPVSARIFPVAQTLNDPATPSQLRGELNISWRRTTSAVKGEPLGVLPAVVPQQRS
jgi:hypothetical protein